MTSSRPLLRRDTSIKLYKDDATEASSSSHVYTKQGSSRSLMSSIAKSASTRSLMSSISLDESDQELCVSLLEAFCTANGYKISSDLIFRFAFFHHFDSVDAKEAIAKCSENKYLNLKMDGDLAEQFESRMLFPVPRLRLKNDNGSVVYMRPSQYLTKSQEAEEMMIESICYVLNDCNKSEAECRNGVSLVINMYEWGVNNFDKKTWTRVMKVLQGDLVPTKVKTVLIVDAPKRFVAIWSSLKRQLLTNFSRNVHLIKKAQLSGFLMEGYEQHMPSDFFASSGNCPSEMVEDYVDLKSYQEE